MVRADMHLIARTAIATVAVVALSGDNAAACGTLWRCKAYPPIFVPAYDPQRGPVWTSNGWSYPEAPVYFVPLPYPRGPYRPDRYDFDPRAPGPVDDYGRPLK